MFHDCFGKTQLYSAMCVYILLIDVDTSHFPLPPLPPLPPLFIADSIVSFSSLSSLSSLSSSSSLSSLSSSSGHGTHAHGQFVSRTTDPTMAQRVRGAIDVVALVCGGVRRDDSCR